MKLFPLHLIPNDTKIDFMRLRKPVLILMLVIAVASVGVIVGKGFNYALEFTGGTLVQTSFQKTVDVDQVREQLSKAGFENAQVQNARGGNEVMIRLQAREQHNNRDDAASTVAEEVRKAVSTPHNPATVQPGEFVGPQVGKDLALNGVYATVFMLVGFLIYIAFRFEWKFAVVASLTALFDLLVTVAFVSLTGREFDLTVLAGLLSVMGFAINDIIVVFDRVRENFRAARGAAGSAQPLDQPDALAHGDHRGDVLPVGTGAVHLRRRVDGRPGRDAHDRRGDRGDLLGDRGRADAEHRAVCGDQAGSAAQGQGRGGAGASSLIGCQKV